MSQSICKDYTKAKLIEMALTEGVIKNKTQGLSKTKEDLCELLGIPQVIEEKTMEPKFTRPTNDKACRNLNKDEIFSVFKPELESLNISKADMNRYSINDICNILFPTELNKFDVTNCEKMDKKAIKNYALLYGVPLPANLSNDEACRLIENIANKKYNTIKNPKFNDEDVYQVDSAIAPLSSDIKLNIHQKRVAKHMLRHRGLLAVHDVGTGKTFAAIAAMKGVITKFPEMRVVVIVPKTLIKNFVSQADSFGISSKRYEIYSYDSYMAFYKKVAEKGKVPICSNTFLIIDEVHNLRTKPIFNTKAVEKKESKVEIKNGLRSAAIMQCAAQAAKVLLLTATPFINKYSDIINYLAMLNGDQPNQIKLSPSEIERLVEFDKGNFYNKWQCKVSFHMPERDLSLYPKLLEEKIVPFTMDDNYYQVYKKIEKGLLEQYVLDILETQTYGTMFYTKLRQAVNLNLDGKKTNQKITWILNFIKDHVVDKKEKTVIYSNWKKAGINQLAKYLDEEKVPYVFITGDVDIKDRERYVDMYNEGKVDLILISKAGGEGLNLRETRHVIIMESNWNPATEKQIIGRAVRFRSHLTLPEEKRNVQVWRLMMDKPEKISDVDTVESIDRKLYKMTIEDKLNMQNKILGLLKESAIESFVCKCRLGSDVKACDFVPAIVYGEREVPKGAEDPFAKKILTKKPVKKIKEDLIKVDLEVKKKKDDLDDLDFDF